MFQHIFHDTKVDANNVGMPKMRNIFSCWTNIYLMILALLLLDIAFSLVITITYFSLSHLKAIVMGDLLLSSLKVREGEWQILLSQKLVEQYLYRIEEQTQRLRAITLKGAKLICHHNIGKI